LLACVGISFQKVGRNWIVVQLFWSEENYRVLWLVLSKNNQKYQARTLFYMTILLSNWRFSVWLRVQLGFFSMGKIEALERLSPKWILDKVYLNVALWIDPKSQKSSVSNVLSSNSLITELIFKLNILNWLLK
jgi:hypothetical protein